MAFQGNKDLDFEQQVGFEKGKGVYGDICLKSAMAIYVFSSSCIHLVTATQSTRSTGWHIAAPACCTLAVAPLYRTIAWQPKVTKYQQKKKNELVRAL